MIEKTKELVEAKYTVANGYKHDAKVLVELRYRMYMVVIFSFPLFIILALFVFLWSSLCLVVTTFRRLALFW